MRIFEKKIYFIIMNNDNMDNNMNDPKIGLIFFLQNWISYLLILAWIVAQWMNKRSLLLVFLWEKHLESQTVLRTAKITSQESQTFLKLSQDHIHFTALYDFLCLLLCLAKNFQRNRVHEIYLTPGMSERTPLHLL